MEAAIVSVLAGCVVGLFVLAWYVQAHRKDSRLLFEETAQAIERNRSASTHAVDDVIFRLLKLQPCRGCPTVIHVERPGVRRLVDADDKVVGWVCPNCYAARRHAFTPAKKGGTSDAKS